MSIPQRVFDGQIYGFSADPEGLIYGIVLGVDDTWLALACYEPEGNEDGLTFVRIDDVEEIQLTTERLQALRRLVIAATRGTIDVAATLSAWSRSELLLVLEFTASQNDNLALSNRLTKTGLSGSAIRARGRPMALVGPEPQTYGRFQREPSTA